VIKTKNIENQNIINQIEKNEPLLMLQKIDQQ
jgi:hypothetical protein